MKRIIMSFILLTTIVIANGCANKKIDPIIINKSSDSDIGEDIKYKIDKVNLSKSFQNIEPSIELIKKGLEYKLFISLGLIESSGVEINNVKQVGHEVNIYVENQSDPKNSNLVVPQVVISLKGSKSDKIEDYRFNVVNENYSPIQVKFDINEAINKINSEFNISTTTFPNINILSENDKILWDLTYYSIFDKSNIQTPIMNLSVRIDANNGDIIESNKDFISNFIDKGNILDHVLGKYILYRKVDNLDQNHNSRESLWYYNIESKEKALLYSSNAKIVSAKFNPNSKQIAILESKDGNNEIYIIQDLDKKAFKVVFEDPINPQIVRWNGRNNLYIVETNEKESNVYKHDIKKDKTLKIESLGKNITDLQILGNNFLITEGDENNTKIHLTTNWKESLFYDFGSKAIFVNDHQIAYLKHQNKENINMLYIYDINKSIRNNPIDANVVNCFPIWEDNIAVVQKNQKNNNLSLNIYNTVEDKFTAITDVLSDNISIFMDKDNIYIDLILPFNEENIQMIYSIDMNKIANLEP